MNRIQLESEIDEILDRAINELDINEYIIFLDTTANRIREMKSDFWEDKLSGSR